MLAFIYLDGRMDMGKLVPPLTFPRQRGKKNPRAKDQCGVTDIDIFSQILSNTLNLYLYFSLSRIRQHRFN